jgi:phospholipid transport system substrate-binding protein
MPGLSSLPRPGARIGARVLVLSLALVLGLAPPSPALAQEATGDAAAGDPAAPVERLHAALADAMTADAYAARAEALAPVVRDAFAVDTMLRVITGEHWGAMPADDRAALADTFRGFMVANYASRFDGDGGARFETIGTRRLDGRALVEARLERPDGEPVDFDYLVQPAGDGWAIVDVYVDGGISELALRRSEFAGPLRRGGAQALIGELESIIADLEAG